MNSVPDAATPDRSDGQKHNGKAPARSRHNDAPREHAPGTHGRQPRPGTGNRHDGRPGQHENEASAGGAKRTPPPAETLRDLQPSGLAPAPDLPDDAAPGFLQPGIKPTIELLQTTPEKIDTVFVRKGRKGKDTELILDLCRKGGVRFSLTDEAGLDRLWHGRHQGVIARLFTTGFTEYSALLTLAPDEPLQLIVALDQVQDPGNAGALARTLYALGGAGLVVPRHNGVYLGAAAARVAAGALDKLPVAKAANLAQALDEALDAGYTVYGADAAPAETGVPTEDVFAFVPRLPAVLVLGGEDGGLRPVIRKRCTAFLTIPFAREFDSLNVAQAGAVIIGAFAAARRRGS